MTEQPPLKNVKQRRNFFRSLSRNRDAKTKQKTTEHVAKEAEDDESYVHVNTKLEEEEDDDDEPMIYGPPGLLRQNRDEENEHLAVDRVVLSPLHHSNSQQTADQRLSIHRTTPSLSNYKGTPITKHYDISKQILTAFDSHFSSHLWVTAYAVGLQFVELALLEIPKHGYFYAERHERERMQNSLDAVRVANQIKAMEGVEGYDGTRVEKLLELGLEQVEKASSDQDIRKFQSKRELVEEELRTDDDDWITVQCEPGSLLASCSESFAAFSGSSSASVDVPPPPLLRDRSESTLGGDESLGKALYLSGLEVQPAAFPQDPPAKRFERLDTDSASRKSARLELSTLAHLYHEDFDSLQLSGRVRVSYADTYQGRVKESTNGCAVIAPLMAQLHLQKASNRSLWDGDPGLPDRVIQHCIDVETPIVLGALRERLGLSEYAFLIPSDVHDYLMDEGKLLPKQFLTVTGGNILDDQHLKTFIEELATVKDRKVAATVFFHEHVLAILKLRRVDPATGQVSFWYDVIDSLPLKETLRSTNETTGALCERLGLGSDHQYTPEEQVEFNEMAIVPKTVRIRCLDQESLMAVLRWYACSKFSEENINYIDQYLWDDVSSDFDPRVFQAFVWGSVDNYPGAVHC